MKSHYRILMFSPAFAPMDNPEAIVNSKLALAMLSAGWDVHIISKDFGKSYEYQYNLGWGHLWLPLKDRTVEIKYSTESAFSNVYDTVKSAIQMKYSVDGCRWANRAYAAGAALHQQSRFNIILSRSTPDAAHLPALRLSQEFNIPWVANWNDPMAYEDTYTFTNNRVGILKRYTDEKFLQAIVRKARWCTFPSARLRSYCSRYLKGVESKSSVIPHIMLPLEKNKVLKKSKRLRFCFAGNLLPERNPELLFSSVAEFIHRENAGSSFILEFVGLIRPEYKKYVQKYIISDQVHFWGARSFEETRSILVQCDALLIVETRFFEGITLPAKFVDYVQAQRPILALSPTKGTLVDYFKKYRCGITVDCTSKEAIVIGFQKFYRAWKNKTIQTKYSSTRIASEFSPDKIIGLYDDIFNLVVK